MRKRVNWVLDADIRRFFDTIDHGWLTKCLEHRIADPRVLRLIQKWLKAGVLEAGNWSETSVGTPPGAVPGVLLGSLLSTRLPQQRVHFLRLFGRGHLPRAPR